MPTGPFRKLGVFHVVDAYGNTPTSGSSTKITVVKATSKYIKYTRKDARFPKSKIHHAKVKYDVNNKWVAYLGNFQMAIA